MENVKSVALECIKGELVDNKSYKRKFEEKAMTPTDDAEFDDDKQPAQRTKQVNQTSTPPRKIPTQSISPQDTDTISNPPSPKKEPNAPSVKNPSPFPQ